MKTHTYIGQPQPCNCIGQEPGSRQACSILYMSLSAKVHRYMKICNSDTRLVWYNNLFFSLLTVVHFTKTKSGWCGRSSCSTWWQFQAHSTFKWQNCQNKHFSIRKGMYSNLKEFEEILLFIFQRILLFYRKMKVNVLQFKKIFHLRVCRVVQHFFCFGVLCRRGRGRPYFLCYRL